MNVLKLISRTAASPTQDEAMMCARQKGCIGLLAMQSLLTIQALLSPVTYPEILLLLVAFTSSRDPWTTPLSISTATNLLSKLSDQAHRKEFIIDFILQKFIRPLFSKSKLEAITTTGRKAMPSSAPLRRFDVRDADERTKPWTIDVPYAVTVFEWTVANSSVRLLHTLHGHFHLMGIYQDNWSPLSL